MSDTDPWAELAKVQLTQQDVDQILTDFADVVEMVKPALQEWFTDGLMAMQQQLATDRSS